MIVDHVTNFRPFNDVMAIVLEDELGEGGYSRQISYKGLQQPPPRNLTKNRTKNKELSRIEVERATPQLLFITEVESMVIQQFIVPSYLRPLPMVGLVECMHFMFFFCYDWESNNLVGFNKILLE